MKVKLFTYTNNPELTVAIAHKACYTPLSLSEILKQGMSKDEIARHIADTVKSGHTSVLEHANFTFAIEDVSRSLTHQLVRHRIANYSQSSQRYVDMSDFNAIKPSEIQNNKYCEMIFDDTMELIATQYKKLCDILYNQYISEGMSKRESKTRSQENARSVLPNACPTQIVTTMNARSLLNFFAHRCCNRAQDEIRSLADEMLKQCKVVAPNIFAYAGAPCEYGKCPEGKMGCGSPRGKESSK